MGSHFGFFFYRDIGRVADEAIDGGQGVPGFGVEEVELMEGDGEAEGVGVSPGYGESVRADVAGMDCCGGEVFGEGEGDAAAAGAYVEDGWGALGL